MSKIKPQFKHDCPDCVFIGRTRDFRPFDLYVHYLNGEPHTLTGRYGPLPMQRVVCRFGKAEQSGHPELMAAELALKSRKVEFPFEVSYQMRLKEERRNNQ